MKNWIRRINSFRNGSGTIKWEITEKMKLIKKN